MRAELGEMKVYIERDIPWEDRLKLYIVKKFSGRNHILDAEGNWHEMSESCLMPNDFKHITLPEGALKGIVEAIASNFGILPDKVQFAEDELKAVKNHLEDMRKIVNQLLLSHPSEEFKSNVLSTVFEDIQKNGTIRKLIKDIGNSHDT